MKPHIDYRGLCRISDNLCFRCNLTPPKYTRLMEMYFSPEPHPILLENPCARAWIDKYYAAYRRTGEKIRYVYLSRYHIAEEEQALSDLRAQRGLYLELPEEITLAFQEARDRMEKSHTQYILCEIE